MADILIQLVPVAAIFGGVIWLWLAQRSRNLRKTEELRAELMRRNAARMAAPAAIDDQPPIAGAPGKYCSSCGTPLPFEAGFCSRCGSPQRAGLGPIATLGRQPRSKLVAAMLALFLGGVGMHRFYLGEPWWGVIYLVFCLTFIPALAGFVEGIMLLAMSEDTFAARYAGE